MPRLKLTYSKMNAIKTALLLGLVSLLWCQVAKNNEWQASAFLPEAKIAVHDHHVKTHSKNFFVSKKPHSLPEAWGVSLTGRKKLLFGKAQDTQQSEAEDDTSTLEVVLFGLGDLRITDHGGLSVACNKAANSRGKSKVMPLFLLNEDNFGNFPGADRHALDTALMISSALKCLSEELQSNIGLELQFCATGNISEYLERLSNEAGFGQINVHVCDLGAPDNSLGYNPFSSIQNTALSSNINICTWSCELRVDPLKNLSDVPSTYPEYKEKYCGSNQDILPALDAPTKELSLEQTFSLPMSFASKQSFPEQEQLLSLLLHKKKGDTSESFLSLLKLEEDSNTGLFGTHWGGFNPSTCNEVSVLGLIKEYATTCQLSDELLLKSKNYAPYIKQNLRSLEHYAIGNWQSSAFTQTANLVDGELIVRALSAPLLLGCISNRQIKKFARIGDENEALSERWFEFLAAKTNPLDNLAESREWQKIFSTKCIMEENERAKPKGELKYKYWRWQGFLCRYGVASLVDKDIGKNSEPALVLIHGFGASGSQWEGMISEVASQLSGVETDEMPRIAFAPDLIGFGQCEKPYLTYTQYLWESYSSDFIKEIVLGKFNCASYVVGGNSIGGYTSMGCAADDTITLDVEEGDKLTVTSSGAPGSGKCNGVILMNSAGTLLTEKQCEKLGDAVSIAEATAKSGLPPCKPPPKPVATLFGRGLLWYLRPRIESICVNLYPTNPTAVNAKLCDSIRRDSLDPGAIAVMISGSKLPPPRTGNELLGADFGSAKESSSVKEGKWMGPVLIAQGMKDPLMDASARVKLFENLRSDIAVEPLNGGHCPHDELPAESAKAFLKWASTRKVYSKGATVKGVMVSL